MFFVHSFFAKIKHFKNDLVHINGKRQRQENQVKGMKRHVLFGSAWKWSSLCKGCSLCAAQSTAGQTLGKPMACFLQEQVGRCRASSAPLSPKFYTQTNTITHWVTLLLRNVITVLTNQNLTYFWRFSGVIMSSSYKVGCSSKVPLNTSILFSDTIKNLSHLLL